MPSLPLGIVCQCSICVLTPARAMYYIPSVYAGPRALTCVLAASNAGRALCPLGTMFMQARRIRGLCPESGVHG